MVAREASVVHGLGPVAAPDEKLVIEGRACFLDPSLCGNRPSILRCNARGACGERWGEHRGHRRLRAQRRQDGLDEESEEGDETPQPMGPSS